MNNISEERNMKAQFCWVAYHEKAKQYITETGFTSIVGHAKRFKTKAETKAFIERRGFCCFVPHQTGFFWCENSRTEHALVTALEGFKVVVSNLKDAQAKIDELNDENAKLRARILELERPKVRRDRDDSLPQVGRCFG